MQNKVQTNTDRFIDWHLTALSAQISYIVDFEKYDAIKKSEINDEVDNFICWEYIK